MNFFLHNIVAFLLLISLGAQVVDFQPSKESALKSASEQFELKELEEKEEKEKHTNQFKVNSFFHSSSGFLLNLFVHPRLFIHQEFPDLFSKKIPFYIGYCRLKIHC
jgi:hypothetical protein